MFLGTGSILWPSYDQTPIPENTHGYHKFTSQIMEAGHYTIVITCGLDPLPGSCQKGCETLYLWTTSSKCQFKRRFVFAIPLHMLQRFLPVKKLQLLLKLISFTIKMGVLKAIFYRFQYPSQLLWLWIDLRSQNWVWPYLITCMSKMSNHTGRHKM